MKAIILDMGNRYLKTFTGSYKNGSFYYKAGIIGDESHFDYDPADAFQTPNWLGQLETTAIYIFDGKNYKQKSLNAKTGEYNIVDYIQTFKIAELQKKIILKKPFSLQELTQLLMMIITIVLIITTVYVVSGAKSTIQTGFAPYGKALNTSNKIGLYLVNETRTQSAVCNATIAYLKGQNPTGSISPISG